MSQLERNLFSKFHGYWGKNRMLDAVIIFFSKYALYVFLIGAAWRAYIFPEQRPIFFLALIIALIARFVVTSLIHVLFPRKRPFAESGIAPLAKEPLMHPLSSFPSGHMTFFFSFVAAAAIFAPAFAWFYILGLIIGFGRVYTGAHWISDVVVGIALGLFLGLAAAAGFRFFGLTF